MDVYKQKNEQQLKFILKGNEPKPVLQLVLEDFYGYLQEVTHVIKDLDLESVANYTSGCKLRLFVALCRVQNGIQKVDL